MSRGPFSRIDPSSGNDEVRIWRPPKSLPELVGEILREAKARRRSAPDEALIEAVRRAVPDPMVDHVRVASLRAGRLILEVDGAAALQELSAFHRGTILAALKADPEAPRVVDVTFKVGARAGGANEKWGNV